MYANQTLQLVALRTLGQRRSLAKWGYFAKSVNVHRPFVLPISVYGFRIRRACSETS